MKKLLAIIVLGLLWSGNSFSNDINALNAKLLEIEGRLDNCLNTKNKQLCENLVMENPLMLEVMGNENFAKLSMSPKDCGIGTKCGATSARILSKVNQVAAFILE